MADGVETIDDRSLFDNTVSNAAPEPAPQPEPVQAEPTAQPRDEAGKFAAKPAVVEPKVEAVAPQPQAEPAKTDPEGHIPSWRLREERERREAAERRYADLERRLAAFEQQQPKQEPVDFFTDPDQALQQRLNPFEQQFSSFSTETRVQMSEIRDIAAHGMKAHAELEAALKVEMDAGNPEMAQLRARMAQSRDPVAVAREWYQRDKILKEVGSDPAAYRQKLIDEALSDPAVLAKAMEKARGTAAQTGNTVNRPAVSSLPSITKVGATALPEGQDQQSDTELFQNITSRPRRSASG